MCEPSCFISKDIKRFFVIYNIVTEEYLLLSDLYIDNIHNAQKFEDIDDVERYIEYNKLVNVEIRNIEVITRIYHAYEQE